MIVGVTITDNRETEIVGALLSVLDRVDRMLVVDTGVTDRTLERAREVAGEKLVVAKHEWVDFSAARNFGLDEAKAIGAEWILVVDSDERVNFGSVNIRRALARTNADVLLVESDDGHYPKQRFIRADSNVHFFGPTHETIIDGKRELLRGVTFSELPKTEERVAKKCARDVALLTGFLAQNPTDPRWWMYLGMSLEGVGKREQAAEAFGRCVRLRKTGREAAWAAYRQAEQFVILGRLEEAIAAAAVGVGADATFVECAQIAAEAALKLGLKNQAVAWARMAESLGKYKGCGFSFERHYFRYPAAFYELPYGVLKEALSDPAARTEASADFEAAKLARIRSSSDLPRHNDLDWLSVSRHVAENTREEARTMLRPKTLSSTCASARAIRIQFEPPGGRLPMNPSICWHRGEMWCVVRAVNYSMKGRSYTIHDPYGVIRTENYLGRLSKSGEFIDPTPMLDLDKSPRERSNIVGYEDIRLASIKGRDGKALLTGSATVCDRDPEGRRQIARLHFDKKGNVKRADVQRTNQLHEKNWMPLSVDGEFKWIYSIDPTAILPGPLRHCPFKLEHLRGGGATKFGQGYLCAMHEVIDASEGRVYLHRFVRMDRYFNVTAVTPAWVFSHHGIEFCAGLAFRNGQIILSYGIEDREAWIMRIDAKDIEALEWMTP